MKKLLGIMVLGLLLSNTYSYAQYEPWKCLSKKKCVTTFYDSQIGTINVEFNGKTKNNLPYKGKINLLGTGDYAEGTWKIKSNNSPFLLKGFHSIGGNKYYYKKKGIYKTIYWNGDSFEGKYFKSLQPKEGTYLKNNGDKYEGTYFDREKNIFKSGNYYPASGGKAVYQNGKYISKKSKSSGKSRGNRGGFLSPIFGLLAFFVVYIIVHFPCEILYRSTQNSLARFGIIVGGIIVYVFLLSATHNFIGFEIGTDGGKPRFFGESR